MTPLANVALPREVAGQVQVLRAGDVARPVVLPAVRVPELPAHIEDHRGRQRDDVLDQLTRRDEEGADLGIGGGGGFTGHVPRVVLSTTT